MSQPFLMTSDAVSGATRYVTDNLGLFGAKPSNRQMIQNAVMQTAISSGTRMYRVDGNYISGIDNEYLIAGATAAGTEIALMGGNMNDALMEGVKAAMCDWVGDYVTREFLGGDKKLL